MLHADWLPIALLLTDSPCELDSISIIIFPKPYLLFTISFLIVGVIYI